MKRKRTLNIEALKASNEAGDIPLKQEIKFFLPPGAKLSDIYMDAQDLAQELKIGKRVIYDLRREGKLSYSTLSISKGKIFYFRQEIAAILHSNTVPATNSLSAPLKKRK